MARDLDPDRVDQDGAGDPCGAGQRHLGGDPAADRVAARTLAAAALSAAV